MKENLNKHPLQFSVIVPLYNTPAMFLKDMIDSVQNQSYTDWELCLADGSDGGHAEVGRCCMEYARKDNRVVYKKLEQNCGISENTNHAIGMSNGDYLVMLDHDDILHQDALKEVFKRIEEDAADFIYTDEAKFTDDITRVQNV